MRGLKENVIMGRLIPAGTGMEFYRKIKISDEVIEGLDEGGMEGEYQPEYLVEPEHVREGVAEAWLRISSTWPAASFGRP